MKLAVVTHKTRHGLLSPNNKPGEWFGEKVLGPLGLSFGDIAILAPTQRLKPDITHVAYLGYQAAKELLDTKPGMTFHKARGNLFNVDKRWATVSFNHQEAFDMTMSGGYDDDEQDDQGNPDDHTGKDDCYVRPINWRWWLEQDIAKLVKTPCDYKFPAINVQINVDPLIAAAELNRPDNKIIFMDIETRFKDYSLDCIGFACDDRPVYVVPFYGPDHKLVYPRENVLTFLIALARAMGRCRTVVHNAQFEFIVLPLFYHVPFGNDVYDTMLGHHRIWPFVEKSLAAAISYWTRLPYHKDLYQVPKTQQAFTRLMHYNAKDVWGTREVYEAQQAYIQAHPEFARSIEDGQKSEVPYLLASLTGWNVDEARLSAEKDKLNRELFQLKRMFKILLPQWDNFNPKSTDQCARLLHGTLGLKVGRRKAKTGKPELDEKNLQKIRVRQDTPIEIGELIAAIINYRFKAKALETITFEPYPGV